MTNSPQSIFSLNVGAAEEGDVNEQCPCCDLPFLEHTNSQLVKCALLELEGGTKS